MGAKKKPVMLLSIGGLLLISAIISFAISIYHGFSVNQQHVETFWIDAEHTTHAIKVNPSRFIQVAVKIDITSNAIDRGVNDEDDLQYQFPFRYQILDSQKNILYEQQKKITWNSGTRSLTNKQIGNNKGTLTVETGFDKIQISPPGEIQIIALLENDSIYKAKAEKIELIVYDNVYKHTQRVVTGIVLFVAGAIALFFGLISLVNSTTPSNNLQVDLDAQPLGSSDKNCAMLIHLSAFSGYIIPFGGLLGPLIIWLVKRSDHSFIDMHGKEAVNFRISLIIYFMIAFILCFVLIGFLFIFVLWLMDLILTIIAAIKASDGRSYRYPFSIRFIK
ncbi:DUF4870 domain-containing protein [Pseudomonadota bacterium]